MNNPIALGADVGGSHISCSAVHMQQHVIIPESHVSSKLDNQWPAGEIISAWANTIRQVLQKLPPDAVAGIGFAMPGPFDYVKGIALFRGNNKKYESLYGLNVANLLRQELQVPEQFSIRFINDATAFALGEDFMGASRGTSRSLSITLGTGFGSAFLHNSLPVVTGETVPETGAVWHLPYQDGNADDYFSTRGLLHRYEAATGVALPGVKELAALAASDKTAAALFVDFGECLGEFLGPWMKGFGAEILVIGGNISHAFTLFGPSLEKSFQQQQVQARVAVAQWHEEAAIIGSALLADNAFYEKLLPAIAHM
ncbi:MAG: ROK family protein [Chitinophagaceae bacterium]|nr:ROK family protein [Chitinophagaceae bacterium]